MDVMTEIFFHAWVGGLSTKSTYGNGVPFGYNTEISDFSDTSIDCFPFIGSGNHQQHQFLDKGVGLVDDEHLEGSK